MPYLFSFIHNALITSGTPSTCAGLRLDMEEIVEYYISSTVASWTSNAVPERWRHPSTTPPIVLAPTTSVEPLQQMITWSHVTTSIAHLFLTGKIQFLYTFPSKVISTRNEIISYFIPKILVWYYLPIHKKKIKKSFNKSWPHFYYNSHRQLISLPLKDLLLEISQGNRNTLPRK